MPHCFYIIKAEHGLCPQPFQKFSATKFINSFLVILEVCDIAQEVVIKTILKKKKCKRAKWLSEEAFRTAMKRREAKGKGEKERYTDLNAWFTETLISPR